MPQLIALAAVGATVYFGARLARRVLTNLETSARQAAKRAEERRTGMVTGGDLKPDPETGVYRVESRER